MYCILRIKKIKDRNQITSLSEHNFRLRHQNNIDQNLTQENEILINTLNVNVNKSNDFQIKLSEHYDSLKIKERSDNVLMTEFIVSASPEFFENKSKDEIKKWADVQVKFFKQEFGENLKLGVLHLDELTPHIHFSVSTEIKSVKKYKNQKGEFFKESYSLNAKRWNPEFLMGLHDRHALINTPFSLKRGKKGSDKKHKPLKTYYKELEENQKKLEEGLEAAEKYKRYKEIYPQLRDSILSSYESIKALFKILDDKELNDDEINIIDNIAKQIPNNIDKKPKNKSTI